MDAAVIKSKNEAPKTLFQLFKMLAKKFIKSIIWRIAISAITFVLVFVVHTYLMVVINDTLRVITQYGLFEMILNLVPTRVMTPQETSIGQFNVYIFWIIISNIVFGSIGRIISFGPKQFAVDLLALLHILFKNTFKKFGAKSLTLIIFGVALSILMGTFVLNSAVSIALAFFLFLALSQREKSFMILVMTIIKSDFQRLFRIKDRQPLDIDKLSILGWGVIIGLLIVGAIPAAILGQPIITTIVKLNVFVAFVIVGSINTFKKGKGSLTLFLVSCVGFFFLLDMNVFADDSGWSESGKTLEGWLANGGTPQAMKLGLSPAMLASLANLLGPMFPGFMKDLLKNPKTNPYDYIRNNLTKDQMDKLKGMVKDANQQAVDAINNDNSYTNFWKGFFKGCANDMSEITTAAGEFTKNLVIDLPTYIYENPKDAFGNSMNFVGDCGKIAIGIGQEIKSVITDIVNNPEILTNTFGMTAKDLITDPIGSAEKVGETLYDMTGLKQIVECTDPNKSAVDRAKLYAEGIIKMYGFIDGAGMGADLGKAGLSKLSNYVDDLVKAAGGSGEKLSAAELRRLFIAKESREMGETFAKDFTKAIKSGAKEDDIMQKIMNIQQDRNSIKALNELAKKDPAAVLEYNKKLTQVFDKVDDQLVDDLSAKLGCKSSEIQIIKPTNSSGQVKIGFDRDITVRINGRDLPPEQWADIYKQKLYDNTKQYFPNSATPESIANKLDHTCTDKFHPEAYGSKETALDHAINKQAHMIKDPEQVGQAITYKGMKHFDSAEKIGKINPIKYEDEVAEGMRQLTKQFNNQVTPAAEHFGASIDSKLQKAIEIMKGLENGKPPVEIEKALRAMGYTKEQVAVDLGKTFEHIVKFGKK
jgi:hypothetical protein